MQTVQITNEESQKILSLSESHFVDLKSKDIEPSKMSKTVSAFANAEGGEIYLGIDENQAHDGAKIRQWRGFNDEEEANSHIRILENLFPLNNDYDCQFLKSEGHDGLVLLISVKKNPQIIKSSNGTIYKRKSAQSIPLQTGEQIKRLELDKGLKSFEDSTINIPIEMVSDSYTIFNFMIEIVPNTTPIQWLKKQLLIVSDLPTVASIVLYADTPQIALPKHCGIKIYRYRTKEEEGSRETLAFDPITIEGSAYSQIFEAVNKTKEIIEQEKVFRDLGLRSLVYPDKALHEIVTNAVLHRDYSIAMDIHIKIFNNRVEVLSPGPLPGHITESNILNEQFARNGKIVRLINKFPNPPNKDVGEGLNTAFKETSDLRLKRPVIRGLENSVLVVINHEPLASAEDIVMQYLESNDSIDNRTGRTLTGIGSADEMKSVFYRLRDRGLLEMKSHPTKRNRNASFWVKPERSE